MDAKLLLDTATVVGGQLVTLGTVAFTIYKASARFRNWFHDMISVPSRVKLVEKELKHNDGSTIKDATQRIEHTLLMQQRKSEILYKAMGIAEFIADYDGRFTTVSSEFCRLVGRSEDDCLGWGWTEYVKMNMEEWKRLVTMRVPVRLTATINGREYVLIAGTMNKVGYYGVITDEANL